MHHSLESELKHYFQFGDFGPASPNLGGTGGGSGEPKEPRLPHGANLWTIQTAMARLQVADREMCRAYFSTNDAPPHTVTPCASDVLHAYYGEGERLQSHDGGGKVVDPLIAVYPLTGICPGHRDGERAITALWHFAELEAGAKGDARAKWDACQAEARSLLTRAQEAYQVAAERVERKRRKTLAETTRGMLG